MGDARRCFRHGAVATGVAVALLSGCGGGSGGASGEPPELQLSALSDVRQAHLAWSGADTVNILYSSDPRCDWDNYSVCRDSGAIAGARGGEHTILSVDHGLDAHTPYYFVAEHDGRRSAVAAARAGAPEFNGDIHASAVDDDYVYLGGDFDTLGIATGGYASFRASNGHPEGPLPTVHGHVTTMVEDPRGGWFVGGYFEQIDGQARYSLARFQADGTLDPDWVPVALESTSGDRPAEIEAMTLSEGRVIVAGRFRRVGSSMSDLEGRRYLAAFDAGSGELDASWQGRVDGNVLALAAYGGRVYVGGRFDQAGVEGDLQERPHLAVFEGATGELAGGWTGTADGRVQALAVDGGRLFVAGSFEKAGQAGDMKERFRLAAFDLASGELDETWSHGLGDTVRALTVHGDSLYVGGAFEEAGPPGAMVGRPYLAAFDLSSGELDPDWTPEVDSDVEALMGTDEGVIAGGRFDMVDGTHQPYLARFSHAGGALDTEWRPTADGRVMHLAEFGGRIHAGGWFNMVGIDGYGRGHLAALKADTGVPVYEWEAAVDDEVKAMLLRDGRLFVGGSFVMANGESRQHVAAFEADTGTVNPMWEAPAAWESPGAHPTGVRDLAYANGRLFAVGRFEVINGAEVHGIAAFDGLTGQLQPQWDAGVSWDQESGSIAGSWAVTVEGDTLFVGGIFRFAGNGSDVSDFAERQRLAAFDLESGVLRADWDGGVDNSIFVMDSHNGRVYAGGLPSAAGNGTDTGTYQEVGRIAAFDAGDGEFLADWKGGVERQISSARVEALGMVGGALFVGGDFDTALVGGEEHPVEAFATFDAATGELSTALPEIGFPRNSYPHTLVRHEGRLFYAGRFQGAWVPADGEQAQVFRQRFLAVDAQTGELLW